MQQKKDEQSSQDFWQDLNKVKINGKQIKEIEQKLNDVKKLNEFENDLNFLFELATLEENEETKKEIINKLNDFNLFLEDKTVSTLLNGEYDDCNAILTLHAGAGGTEAQDWANMLYRMYCMYCEKNNFTVKVIDSLDGDEAGLKSITFLVEGEKAYGYLKVERGVHRLVRISPFDANKRRHTSFASLEVMPEIDDSIDVQINMDEVRVDTYRSSGAGGQHINKTDSAIRMTHLPTGIVVTCQDERSQLKNREKAMMILKAKLYDYYQGQKNKEYADSRKAQVGTGDRSERIRTYNFPQGRITDHRIGYTAYNLLDFMNGNIDELISQLQINDQKQRLENLES